MNRHSGSDDELMPAHQVRTDARVLDDPQAAIGGMREEIGRLQFEYRPPANTGLDVSSNALVEAGRLIQREGLAEKRAALVLNARYKPALRGVKRTLRRSACPIRIYAPH
jgi:hypothetical protein